MSDDEQLSPDRQLELLRRFAPTLAHDERELFHPTEVDAFARAATLCRGDIELCQPGELALADLDDRFGIGAHLRFVSDDDRRAVVKDEARRLARKLLSPRLGRVGIFGRILDAIFLVSLLVRPITPQRTTVAAALKAERLGLVDQPPVVYGRVLREGEWLVCHYAYFYVMNDWRSGYRGVNDHEGDWEMAWVFVDPADEQPVWVAASSHDHHGADLRRHWEDPELVWSDGHVTLFPGAGSHALYMRPGDYVTRIDVPALRPLLRAQRWLRRALRIRDDAADRGLGPALGAPFVDAATGDGRRATDWDVRLLDESAPWVGEYRGLWGLDTGDPTGGERGPSGPKFSRNGEIRTSWADPIGFVDLHGTPPPSALDVRLSLPKLDQVLDDLQVEISRRGRLLPLASRTGDPDEMAEESERMTELLQQKAELEDLRRRYERGDDDRRDVAMRSHLTHPAIPLPAPKETGWLLALWAAASIPLILLAVAAVLILESATLVTVLVLGAMVATLLEQLVRRHFQATLRLGLVFGALASIWLVFLAGAITVSRYALGAALVVGAGVLFFANVGELGAAQRFRSRAEAARNAPDR